MTPQNSLPGVPPTICEPRYDETSDGSLVCEQIRHVVRWLVETGAPLMHLQRGLQALSDDGWTIYAVTRENAIIAYRYEEERS